ncbi:MAG: IS1595 family transposase [Cytophagales bacterium]|nr:IS1595 family transposase [Cytophagales bacterium]
MGTLNHKAIQEYLDANVAQGSTLSTDEALFYRPVEGYQKIHVNHSISQYVNEMASTNGIESVWALLKRGYYGTYHHFSKKHVDRYINEFTFRLNEGSCWVDTMDRIESLSKSVVGKRLTYNRLIADA